MGDLKSTVAEVKLAYNIVDYMQSHGLRLKAAGGSTYKGLCPFHNERTPSFSVSAHYQNYHCFGCAAGGDLLKFVQETEHLEFFDALKKLAEEKNIKLDIREEKSGVDYSSLRECMRAISNFYVKSYLALPADHPAKAEVSKRGFAGSTLHHGYAPEGRQTLYKHLREKGYEDETILLTGACSKYEGSSQITDFWTGRLMFFITDVTGKTIGWSGRKLFESDTRGKYVNSRDGVLFDKSASLYNIASAKKLAHATKVMYVNEGQFDVEALHFAGLENAVAASGTAFTEKQGMIIRRMVGESGKIVFCFDGDNAGRAAAEKVFKNVPLIHAQSYVVVLPEGQDPCDYRLANGNQALVDYLAEHEMPLVEFVLNQAKTPFNLGHEIEKTKYIGEAARILKTLASDVLKEAYIRHVSLEAFASIEIVKQAVAKAEPLTHEAPARAEGDSTEEVIAEPNEDELSLEALRERIEEDEFYNLAARILSLVFLRAELKANLTELMPCLPPEFLSTAEQYLNIADGVPVIGELFENADLVALFITNEFFPFSHLLDELKAQELFSYLLKRLHETIEEQRAGAIRSGVAQVLHRSPGQGAAFLARALEAEERRLSETR